MKRVKILLLTMLFVMIGITVSNASYNASNKKVTSGDEVTITVTSTEELDAYNLDLTNKGGLNFVNCSKAKEGDAIISTTENGSIGYMNPSGKTKTLGTYKFKTPDVTETKTYTVEFSVNQGEAKPKAVITVEPKKTDNSSGGNTDNSGNTSSGTENPKPNPEPEKGTVTECRINGVKVNQYLNVKNKDSVPVKVTTSTKERLKIYNDKTKKTYNAKSGQSVNVQVVEGEQTITITLDTGYKTTRRIISTKEAEETPPNVIEEPKPEEVKVILKSLTVKGVKLVTEENEEEEKIDLILAPEFSSEVYEYTLNIPEEQNDITKLDIVAIGDKEDFTIEITGNENLVDGENIITILVKSKDGEKTAEYKIKVNKVAKTVEAITEPVKDETPNTGVEDNFKDIMKLVIGGFIVLIAVVGIIFVLIKFRKKEDDEEIEQFSNTELENDEVKSQEEDADNNSSEDNNHSKGIDFTSILKNKIEEKNEISNRKRMEKENNEELENTEETFEVLKEENTTSKKRGKHF